MSEWQPIETAPKDGTPILLWEKYSDVPCVGFWSKKRSIWAADTTFVDCTNGILESFLEQDLIRHWQPLPEPPKETTDAKTI